MESDGHPSKKKSKYFLSLCSIPNSTINVVSMHKYMHAVYVHALCMGMWLDRTVSF